MRILKLLVILSAIFFATLDVGKPASATRFEAGGWSCTRWEVSAGGGNWYGPWQCVYTRPTTPSYGSDGSGYDEGNFYACRYLRLHRPSNCPESIGMPTSGDYGYDRGVYAGGSGLAKLISLMNGSLTMPGISTQISQALTSHTGAIATRSIAASQANLDLINQIRPICEEQKSRALTGAHGTLYCFQALDRLAAENGDQTFLSNLQNWITINHMDIGIGAFSLSTLIGAFEPDNSLSSKFTLVTADSTCADWWDMAAADGCLP